MQRDSDNITSEEQTIRHVKSVNKADLHRNSTKKLNPCLIDL